MRLYQIPDTSGINSLTITEAPDPTPGPGQVLVRMHAASLNYRDLVVVNGGYGKGQRLPVVPLSDGAGEVVGVGEGVTRVKVGDRVAAIFMQGWLHGSITDQAGTTALGGAIDGVLAELVVFDETGLVHVPDHFSWEEAATLPCAAVTAWNALFASGNLKSGDTLLTLGTGGVSIFAAQFALMKGARVIATSSSDEKLARLKRWGIWEGINYKSEPAWSKKVRILTNGAGADHVIEVGGAGTLEQSLRAARAGGTISFIGILAGKGDFNPNWIFMKHLRLQGIYVGSREMFEDMLSAIAEKRLRPVIDRVFSFEEARDAYRYMESGSHFGKIVIRIGIS